MQSKPSSPSTVLESGNALQSAPSSTQKWWRPGEHQHYAYPGNPAIETIMRMSSVKRWHMIDTRRVQTLAEHSANVALLGWYIAITSPSAFFPHPAMAIAGLLHDLDEAYTGDMPTPTKAALGKDSLQALSARLLPKVFTEQITPECKLLLKLCDLADGIRFVRLNGVDVTSIHARVGVENQLSDHLTQAAKEWPTPVVEHVLNQVLMYAYEESFETGNYVAPMGIPAAIRVLAHDLARGSGDQSGGA